MRLHPVKSGYASPSSKGEAWKIFRRACIVAVIAVVVFASRTCLAESMKVKTIYFIPKNRVARESAIQNMKRFIKEAQAYYAAEMAKKGFFKPGTTQGKTFEYEKDAQGEPLVHIINGLCDDTYYQNSVYWLVQNEVLPKHSNYGSTLVIWSESWGVNPDGSLVGGACGGQSSGAMGGIATLTADALINMDMAKFTDTTLYDGMIEPEFSQYPMKYNVTYPYFCGDTVGELASTAYGSVCHEIGHAFGLLHNFYNDEAPVNGGNLMGNGCRGFRGNYGNFSGEFAVLDLKNAELLNVCPYFNPEIEHNDYSYPCFSTELSMVEPISTNWKLHVKVNASDYGSGLYRSFATTLPPWSPVASAPFVNGVADYFVTKDQIPCPWDLPKAYTFEINAIDNQGNRNFIANWVPSYVSGVQSKIEYLSGSTWSSLKTFWSTTDDVRLAITMVAPDGAGSVRAEIEVQPTGVAFTGYPTHYSKWMTYSGTAVTDYIPLNLTGGRFHYRYCLRADNWTTSCWMVKGSESNSVMNFGIDETLPSITTVVDGGQYTDKTTSLSATWSATDVESGVVGYLVAVGTTPYDPSSGYVSAWRSASILNNAITGLNLVNGTKYYIYAKARNGLGLYGPVGVSDGIIVRTDAPQAVSISQAKGMADGTYIKLQSVLASCNKNDLGSAFYVQQSDRSCGLQINTADAGAITDFSAGQVMTVTGILTTIDGERAISLPEITAGTSISSVSPLILNSQAVGGGTCGLQKAVWSNGKESPGLSNIGLLVKIAGRVTQIDPSGKYFYVDDGSGLRDGTVTGQEANIGVRVAGSTTGRSKGQMLAVTGISSCTLGSDSKLVRVLKTRNTSDIRLL